MTEETAVQGRKFRFSPRAMALAAGALVLAGAAGRWAGRDGGLLWAARLFDHPLFFGVLVLGLLAAALVVAVRSLVVRILTGVAFGLVLLAAFPLFLFASFGAASETSDTAAPGRDDRSLVVEEGADMIDPLWWVYVDEGRGPLTRRWKVGYFNGDVGENALMEASWAGPGRVRLVTGSAEYGDEQVHVIDLDRETGRPLRTVTKG
ncbi:hypothetical protein [Streptomyces sp. cmx-4-25]|uniref:hypothetical protein n=1 Tax=Streptomyces sp. cmx-4-25 TaxID=2790933 RepID=UPI00397FD112